MAERTPADFQRWLDGDPELSYWQALIRFDPEVQSLGSFREMALRRQHDIVNWRGDVDG